VALVPAAGRGLRMGGAIPKQFLSLGGEPLILQSLRTLQAAPGIDQIVLAVPLADVAYCEKEIVSRHRLTKVTKVVAGGVERQDSVRSALAQVHSETEIVLIHDAVRPFMTLQMIAEVVAAAKRGCGDYCASDAGYREAGADGWDDRANGRSYALVACANSSGFSTGLDRGRSHESARRRGSGYR
jgi:2-C-methyl-D-erythritol 4-phosphate cytidylyltransferase